MAIKGCVRNVDNLIYKQEKMSTFMYYTNIMVKRTFLINLMQRDGFMKEAKIPVDK